MNRPDLFGWIWNNPGKAVIINTIGLIVVWGIFIYVAVHFIRKYW